MGYTNTGEVVMCDFRHPEKAYGFGERMVWLSESGARCITFCGSKYKLGRKSRRGDIDRTVYHVDVTNPYVPVESRGRASTARVAFRGAENGPLAYEGERLIEEAYNAGLVELSADARSEGYSGFWVSTDKIESFVRFIRSNTLKKF